jgi:hypothetical protein
VNDAFLGDIMILWIDRVAPRENILVTTMEAALMFALKSGIVSE